MYGNLGQHHSTTAGHFGSDGLGNAIRTLLNLLFPEVIVLGGGVFTAADVLEAGAGLAGGVRPTCQKMPQLWIAELGDEADRLGTGCSPVGNAR